jgi:predicted GNAT family N-acyltransferase
MFVITTPSSPAEFDEYYDLRWRILRAPWDQPRGSERDELEDCAEHVGARDEEGRLVGVGRLHFADEVEAQIRYMAVAEDVRGAGVGRAIVERLEAIAQSQNAHRITLHSRENAVGFYERLGYRATGAGPLLFGVVPHLNMAKELA